MVSTRSHHRKAAPAPSTPLALPDRRRTRSRRPRGTRAGDDSAAESVESSLLHSEFSQADSALVTDNEQTSNLDNDHAQANATTEAEVPTNGDTVVTTGADPDPKHPEQDGEETVAQAADATNVEAEDDGKGMARSDNGVGTPIETSGVEREDERAKKDELLGAIPDKRLGPVPLMCGAVTVTETTVTVTTEVKEILEDPSKVEESIEENSVAEETFDVNNVDKERMPLPEKKCKANNTLPSKGEGLPGESERTSLEAAPQPANENYSYAGKEKSCEGAEAHSAKINVQYCEAEKAPVEWSEKFAEEKGTLDTMEKQSLSEEHPQGVSEDFSLFSPDTASVFLKRDRATSRLCRKLLADSYLNQVNLEFGDKLPKYQIIPQRRKNNLPPMGPLSTLGVGEEFGSDQIWEQIELRNKPLLSHMQRRIRTLQKSLRSPLESTGDGMHSLKDSGRLHINPVADHPPEYSSGGNIEDSDAESLSSGAEDLVTTDKTGGSSEEIRRKSKRRVSFAPDPVGAADARSGRQESEPQDKLDDGFFNLDDMEIFADEAEQLAVAGKLISSDSETDNEESGDSERNNESDLGTELVNVKPRYSDFFDPPSESHTGAMQKQERISRLLGKEVEDDKIADVDIHTPLTASRSITKRMIDAIEEDNVTKKPWQLTGEIRGHSRPKDSLLETSLDHDTSVRPGGFDDSKKNETIEDLIRQRILDGLFDDVVDTNPEAYIAENAAKKVPPPEVSQEKPSEGLAEVYAREYLEAKEKSKQKVNSQEVRRAEEAPETKEQKDVNRLYDNLARKLDSLAGLHFMPSLGKKSPEMTVRGSIKALASEEAIPEAISDTNVLAPKEVYSADHKNVKGEKEMTKVERKAARGRTKQASRKSNAAKRRAAELMQKSNPVLADKRRAEAAFLRKGKKVRVAKENRTMVDDAKGAITLGKKVTLADETMDSVRKSPQASSLKL